MASNGDLLLGVDGGGTRCRARLARRSGEVLAEGEAGPANLRLGHGEAFAAVLDAAGQCFAAAGLRNRDLAHTDACLALAGASEPSDLAAARRRPLPFRRTVIVSDAEAACLGAHGGGDGAIVVVGTGSIGWAIVDGHRHRVGGWGFAVSDEGSGAWLGREAIRRALWAHDGRAGWTPLLAAVFDRFARDPHAIVRWTATARPGDYARVAALVAAEAQRGDAAGVELMRAAAAHIDALAARLVAIGARRVAPVGGLAQAIAPYLATETRRRLVAPQQDALAGALRLAGAAAPLPAAAE
ncbi:MAG TPA: BadF/BadG/BcrA/BcrD ATPase family protein [Stellaceae bacterium]|nr:BadF/BadG/BcrA/BcrD ATPase family protein [Stellaceae bacterium]